MRAGTRIGLPELSLGIIPGFGGTQRLPRLVGLQKALTMMLTSAPAGCKEALALGLVDAIVAPADLVPTACKMALEIAAHKRPRYITIDRTDRLESLGEAGAMFDIVRAEARKKAGVLSVLFVCVLAWHRQERFVCSEIRCFWG